MGKQKKKRRRWENWKSWLGLGITFIFGFIAAWVSLRECSSKESETENQMVLTVSTYDIFFAPEHMTTYNVKLEYLAKNSIAQVTSMKYVTIFTEGIDPQIVEDSLNHVPPSNDIQQVASDKPIYVTYTLPVIVTPENYNSIVAGEEKFLWFGEIRYIDRVTGKKMKYFFGFDILHPERSNNPGGYRQWNVLSNKNVPL